MKHDPTCEWNKSIKTNEYGLGNNPCHCPPPDDHLEREVIREMIKPAPTSVTGDEWDKQLHKIMQEEIADRVIYETHLGEEALRRGLQSAQSRIEALIISLLQAKTTQRTHLKQALLGRMEEYRNNKWETDICDTALDDIINIINEELA